MGVNFQTFVDVSPWNTAFTDDPRGSTAVVKASGHVGIYIKLTEGRSSVWPKNLDIVRAAADQELLVGAYHYARPDPRPGDAQAEADWLREHLEPVAGLLTLPAALDIEERRWGLTDPKGLSEWARDWLERFGGDPVVYTGPDFWRHKLGKTRLLERWRLWVAAYPSRQPPAPDKAPPALGAWKPWAWQYTCQGRLPGLKGHYDFSRLYVGG